jgi:PKD repeat protein
MEACVRTHPLLVPHALVAGLIALIACSNDSPTAPNEPAAGPRATVLTPAGGDAYVPGRVLVEFKSGANEAAIANSQGATLGRRFLGKIRMLHVTTGQEMQVAKALSGRGDVVFAEPDYIRTIDIGCPSCSVPTDLDFGMKWDLDNDGTIRSETGTVLANTDQADADMDWLEAYDHLGPQFSGSARIAILDTGIRATHEDIVGRVAVQFNFVNNDPDATDDQGHGTHVAGIAGARGNNAIGVSGVAYGANIDFAIGKVCKVTLMGLSAECASSDIIDGIDWAVLNGANVINMSFGGDTPSTAEQTALQMARAAGVLPFCAAGNNSGPVIFPAAFPECVAVSATDWGDNLASYSNFGPEVDLAAPGGDFEHGFGYSQILSTCFEGDNIYCYKAGTSMASPNAAGLGALIFAVGLTDDDAVLDQMKSTADDLGPAGVDSQFGHGRINAFQAIQDLTPGDPNESPTAGFTYSCNDLDCTFTDQSTDSDGSIVSWSWTFGDGGLSTLQNPSHTYACSGDYTVTLRVTDDGGRSGIDSQTVSVTASTGPPGGPGDISNLMMWLQADAITGLNDGDPVSSWSDLSGTCNPATQGTASKQPVYRVNQVNGLPAVVFDASDDGMATTANPGTTTTIVAVYASRAGASGKMLNGGFSFFMGPYVSFYRNFTYAYVTGSPVTSGRWVIQTLRQSSSSAELHIDGALIGSTGSVSNPGSIMLAKESAYGEPLDGSIAELLVYNRTLTDTELSDVHDFLSAKYTGPPGNASPTAAFTSNCTDLDCTFTDQSTDSDGSVVSWSWDFGDGNTSTAQNPSHSYAAAGTYTVSLTVTDDAGATDATSSDVTVTAPAGNAPPTAAFTSSCTDLDCSFTDQSIDSDGSVVSWSWDFGDGNASTSQNPSHSYAAAGTYMVSLTVSDNDSDSDATSSDVTVSEPGPFDPSDVPDLLMWLEADAITGLNNGDPVSTWPDASGNGQNATQSTSSKRPIYRTNQVNGLPAVEFDASDDGMWTSADSPTTTTIIAVYKSRAGASGKTLNGGFSFFMGPYVSFYRNYTAGYVTGPAVTAGRWVIQTLRQSSSSSELHIDGGFVGTTSSVSNPGNILLAKQGTYGEPLDGSIAEVLVYSRTLTDTELSDVHDWLSNKYVAPPGNASPAAAFTSSCTDLDCTFTDQSSDPDGSVVSWDWDFGDGNTSTSQNPSHSYGVAGTYTVSLTVTDNEGAADATSSDVSVTAPTANTPPTAAFASSCTDLDCNFTDQSTDSDGSVVSWSWDFGDGNSSTSQNPSHSYAAAGTYTVSLTVTDDDGDSDATSSDVIVTEPGPFDPSDVADLLMWLKADAITGLNDGDPVSTWPDASGNGKDATQSKASKRPKYRTNEVNGLPALEFDASDDGLSTKANPPKSTTIIAVYKSRAGASGKTLNGGFSVFMGPYVGFYRNYTLAFVTGPPVTAGRWVIHTLRQSSSLAELFIDGAPSGSTTSTRNPGSIQLARQGNYGEKLDGSIAEVLVYSRTLTDTELADVHAWLQARYAIP